MLSGLRLVFFAKSIIYTLYILQIFNIFALYFLQYRQLQNFNIRVKAGKNDGGLHKQKNRRRFDLLGE